MVIWPLGLGLLLLGSLIRLWAVRYCGKRTIYKTEKDKWLTVHGPYSYVRNPLYISNLLLGCGLIALSKLLWLIPIFAVVGLVYYHLIILFEESRLSGYYGTDYETYIKNVGRWVPKLKSPALDLSTHHPRINPWSEIFRAERWRFSALIGVIILLTFKEYLANLI